MLGCSCQGCTYDEYLGIVTWGWSCLENPRVKEYLDALLEDFSIGNESRFMSGDYSGY